MSRGSIQFLSGFQILYLAGARVEDEVAYVRWRSQIRESNFRMTVRAINYLVVQFEAVYTAEKFRLESSGLFRVDVGVLSHLSYGGQNISIWKGLRDIAEKLIRLIWERKSQR